MKVVGTFARIALACALGITGVGVATPAVASGGVSIGDRVWYDDDGDGRQTGERSAAHGAAGVAVSLYEADGTTLVGRTVTDARGFYSFAGLRPATGYVLRVDLPAGTTFTRPHQDEEANDSDVVPVQGASYGSSHVTTPDQGRGDASDPDLTTLDVGLRREPVRDALTVVQRSSVRLLTETAVHTIPIDVTVTNDGNRPVRGVTVAAPRLGDLEDCRVATLDPGESVTCRGTASARSSDYDAARFVSTATATAAVGENVILSTKDVLKIRAVQAPRLTADLKADRQTAKVNDTVTWTVTLSNTGNVTLGDIRLADRLGRTLDGCPTSLGSGVLTTCQVAVAVTFQDVTAGRLSAPEISAQLPATEDDANPRRISAESTIAAPVTVLPPLPSTIVATQRPGLQPAQPLPAASDQVLGATVTVAPQGPVDVSAAGTAVTVTGTTTSAPTSTAVPSVPAPQPLRLPETGAVDVSPADLVWPALCLLAGAALVTRGARLRGTRRPPAPEG